MKFGVFRGAVAFVDVFNSFAKAGAPAVPTLTNERTRRTTGKLYPICAWNTAQDDDGIITVSVGEYIKIGSKEMRLTRYQTRRKQVLTSPGVQAAAASSTGARH